jgi:ethanolamine utilization protein EutJ
MRVKPFNLDQYLLQADKAILPLAEKRSFAPVEHTNGQLHVGVDLGTAYLVMVVLDSHFQPLAGRYRFAQVVRDGLVVDYIGAVDLLREIKQQIEQDLGFKINHAASGFPPGVPQAEIRAVANVVQAADMDCTHLIDEPSAANNLLGLQEGAILDVGGGTTGIAVLKEGKVIYTADEPTGGTHFSLVIAGSLGIPFEEAEELKKDPGQQKRLFPVVRPVMEKVGSIAAKHLAEFPVNSITLVGGTCAFPGMASVIENYTGISTRVPDRPLFITPIGIAMGDGGDAEEE